MTKKEGEFKKQVSKLVSLDNVATNEVFDIVDEAKKELLEGIAESPKARNKHEKKLIKWFGEKE